MMHPDLRQLAAYLDGALESSTQAELRAHLLTCPACAARLDRLRDDARRIRTTLASRPAPDLRAAVRERRRTAAGGWPARAAASAGAVVVLLLFALLIGSSGGNGTGLRTPDRLFVTDRRDGRLLVLDAAGGALLDSTGLGEQPGSLAYDAARNRLYVVLKQSVVAIEPRTLQPIARWNAAQPLDSSIALALDTRAGRLYVVQNDAVVALALDAPDLEVAARYPLGVIASALALAPDGATLYALDPRGAQLWILHLDSGARSIVPLSATMPATARTGWLAASRDGRSVYALLTEAFDGRRPGLWRVGPSGQVEQSAPLEALPPPWDLELIDDRTLAIPRGNGAAGGVEIVDTTTLSPTARIDPDRDQHHLVAGPGGALFGLNFTHNTVTRYDAGKRAVAWRTLDGGDYQPWDGVFVPGGWRWP